jgi:small subunit ribosomal protein S4e
MSHLKRQEVPKSWPIERKGTKYVVSPSFEFEKGIPILIILRNMLKIADTRKEVKKALHEKSILSNNKVVIEEKMPLLLFDTLTIVPSKKHYRLNLSEGGKFILNEIKDSESNKKISKIFDKKILKGKKIQLNLIDGRNFISKIECKTGDSALINFKDKKIEKIIPLKKGVNVMIFSGKHTGKTGIIENIEEKRKMAEIKTKDKKINVLLKQLMAIE